MKYIALFSTGFVGVALLNASIVVASDSLNARLIYLAGTLCGALVGMSIGSILSK